MFPLSVAKGGSDASERRPAVASSRPAAGNGGPDFPDPRPDFANSRSDFAESRPRFANSRPPFSNSKPTFSNSRPPFSNFLPPVSNFLPPVSNFWPHFSNYRPDFQKSRPDFSKIRSGAGSKSTSYAKEPSICCKQPLPMNLVGPTCWSARTRGSASLPEFRGSSRESFRRILTSSLSSSDGESVSAGRVRGIYPSLMANQYRSKNGYWVGVGAGAGCGLA